MEQIPLSHAQSPLILSFKRIRLCIERVDVRQGYPSASCQVPGYGTPRFSPLLGIVMEIMDLFRSYC